MNITKKELAGLLVSEETFDAALADWPRRPPTGFDDLSWGAACANHVLLVARERGEEPEVAELAH